MGFLDKAKELAAEHDDQIKDGVEKAKDFVGDHEGQIRDGIETGAEKAKDLLPDAHADKVEKVADAARSGLDKLT